MTSDWKAIGRCDTCGFEGTFEQIKLHAKFADCDTCKMIAGIKKYQK